MLNLRATPRCEIVGGDEIAPARILRAHVSRSTVRGQRGPARRLRPRVNQRRDVPALQIDLVERGGVLAISRKLDDPLPIGQPHRLAAPAAEHRGNDAFGGVVQRSNHEVRRVSGRSGPQRQVGHRLAVWRQARVPVRPHVGFRETSRGTAECAIRRIEIDRKDVLRTDSLLIEQRVGCGEPNQVDIADVGLQQRWRAVVAAVANRHRPEAQGAGPIALEGDARPVA